MGLIFFFTLGIVYKYELGSHVKRGLVISRTRHKLRVLVILNASKILAHYLPEYVVCSLKNLFPASEILMKVDPPVTCKRILTVSRKLLHENLGTRKSELINTLLYVTNHEPLGRSGLNP